MIDITDQDELYEYLHKKNLLVSKRQPTYEVLSGGVSCKVVKVTTDSMSFVLKQARSKLQVESDWYSDKRRIFIERDCINVFNEIIPEAVPKLIYHDDDNYLIIMESAPENSHNLKEQLMKGEIDLEVARKLAHILADIHSKAMQDESLKQRFINKEFFKELRVSPYLETVQRKYESISNVIQGIINMLLKDQTTLIHGDFSPKNILVFGEEVYLLDHEVAHIGHPSFDLAFFTNHILLKSLKNKVWVNDYMDMMLCFIEEYFSKINFIDRIQLEEQTIKVLAILFLARVDGKSPVEYITAEQDKDLIRSISFQILELATTFIDVKKIMLKNLKIS